VEDSVIHVLAHLAHDIYFEPTPNACYMLLAAHREQTRRIHAYRGCACVRGEECDIYDDDAVESEDEDEKLDEEED
jgi:hypothetical protein